MTAAQLGGTKDDRDSFIHRFKQRASHSALGRADARRLRRVLSQLPGMTFVSLALGEVNTLYPDVIMATRAVYCLSRGAHFGPAFDNEPPLPPADAISRQKLLLEIQARVEEMDRRGVQYRLIWNLAGDSEVCVNSCDMDGNDEIGCLLAEGVQELFEHC